MYFICMYKYWDLFNFLAIYFICMYTINFVQFVALFSLGRIWEIYTKYIFLMFYWPEERNELALGTIRYSHHTFSFTARTGVMSLEWTWMMHCWWNSEGPALHLGGRFASAIERKSHSLFLLPPSKKGQDHRYRYYGQDIEDEIPSWRLFRGWRKT